MAGDACARWVAAHNSASSKASWVVPVRQSFEGVSRYSLTDAGRSEQERIRKEDLAKIGVTEVETHNP